MKKKWLAALLTTAMLITTAAGCGSNAKKEAASESGSQDMAQTDQSTSGETEENQSDAPQETQESPGDAADLSPVTLRIFFLEGPAGDEELVADYINNLPQVQALNVTVEICKEWNWDRSQLPLQLAGDEQMDIGYDNGAEFLSRVDQQAYTDLSGYLAGDPDFYDYIPEALWKGVSVNGGTYAIPTYKEIGEQWGFLVDKKDLDACGIDASSIKKLADMEPLLVEMAQQDLGAVYIPSWADWLKVGLFDTYDFTPGNLGVIRRQDGAKVENLYETQEFADLVNMMYDWNQKGYIPDEMLTEPVEWITNEANNKHNYCVRYTWYSPCAEYLYAPDYELVPILLEDPVVSNDAARGSVFGVYQKCENPERAYQFLKLWNTDPEIKNAFVYGIPDVHYKLVDGQVEIIKEEGQPRKFEGVNSMSGNVMISYTLVSEPKNKYNLYDEFNQKATPAADLGIVYDTGNVNDKVTNCTAVLEEYAKPLLLGFVEPESGIQTLNEKLNEAGIADVIAELQSQYEAFKAN